MTSVYHVDMAYPEPFARITVLGHFGTATGPEIWTTNFKVGYGGGTTDPTPFLPAIASAIQSFWVSSALNSGSAAFLTELHGAIIGTDGKYLGGATQSTKVYTYGAPVAGTGSGSQPWPTSCVLSLRSSTRGRGPGSHGRMYWPCLATQPAPTTGRYTGATTSAIATAAKTMINAINSAAVATFGPGARVVLASPVREGFMANVDKLLVGDKPDHIERRENATPEAYSTVTLP